MSTGRDSLVNPGKRLPDLSLPAAAGDVRYPVRPAGRRAPVLLLVHGHDCAACADFVSRLEEEHDELREWDAHPLVVVPEPPALAAGFSAGGRFPVLADPEGRLAAALDLRPPALVVADQWGEVHSVESAGEEHRFPTPAEVVDWARFLAIQCPECQGEAY